MFYRRRASIRVLKIDTIKTPWLFFSEMSSTCLSIFVHCDSYMAPCSIFEVYAIFDSFPKGEASTKVLTRRVKHLKNHVHLSEKSKESKKKSTKINKKNKKIKKITYGFFM